MTVVLAALFLDNKVLACERDENCVTLAMGRVLTHTKQYAKKANRPLGEMRGNLTGHDKGDEELEWPYHYILR